RSLVHKNFRISESVLRTKFPYTPASSARGSLISLAFAVLPFAAALPKAVATKEKKKKYDCNEKYNSFPHSPTVFVGRKYRGRFAETRVQHRDDAQHRIARALGPRDRSRRRQRVSNGQSGQAGCHQCASSR